MQNTYWMVFIYIDVSIFAYIFICIYVGTPLHICVRMSRLYLQVYLFVSADILVVSACIRVLVHVCTYPSVS